MRWKSTQRCSADLPLLVDLRIVALIRLPPYGYRDKPAPLSVWNLLQCKLTEAVNIISDIISVVSYKNPSSSIRPCGAVPLLRLETGSFPIYVQPFANNTVCDTWLAQKHYICVPTLSPVIQDRGGPTGSHTYTNGLVPLQVYMPHIISYPPSISDK